MELNRNGNSKAKDIRGQKFSQESLASDLSGAIAGHSPAAHYTLLGFILVLYLVSGFISGALGGTTGLGIIGTDARWESALTLGAMLLWLIPAITQSLNQSLLTAIALTLLSALSSALLWQSGWIQAGSQTNWQPSTFEFSLGVASTVIIGIAISCLNLLTVRFALALALIILNQSKRLNYVGFSVFMGTALLGAMLASMPTPEDPVTADAQGGAIAIGAGLSLAIALCAWRSNQHRGTPWMYPSLLRSWVLQLGVWGSTSFHNLDLSGVSFNHACLVNTDLRSTQLYRTNFQGVTGLKRVCVDNRYLDLELPKVQALLTHACAEDPNYSRLNLRGAYLQNADLRRINFTDTSLNGADLRDADLRGAIFVRTQAIGTDFTGANLTGACIQNWSVNTDTQFRDVQCDFIYRELDEKGEPGDRYPADRNFDAQEFESLHQELSNVAELVFKEGVNWRAFSFGMQKLDLEDEGMGLELKGFERRGDRWVVRVTHNPHVPKQEVERKLTDIYEDMKGLLSAKEQQINLLLGIATEQSGTISTQAAALHEFSQKPFGNSFFITGSTITNLTGSGNIEYVQAAEQVRQIVANSNNPAAIIPVAKQLVHQLQSRELATTGQTQAELMQQVMLLEAEKDPVFKQYLLKEGPKMVTAMKGTLIAHAIRGAVLQLREQP